MPRQWAFYRMWRECLCHRLHICHVVLVANFHVGITSPKAFFKSCLVCSQVNSLKGITIWDICSQGRFYFNPLALKQLCKRAHCWFQQELPFVSCEHRYWANRIYKILQKLLLSLLCLWCWWWVNICRYLWISREKIFLQMFSVFDRLWLINK